MLLYMQLQNNLSIGRYVATPLFSCSFFPIILLFFERKSSTCIQTHNNQPLRQISVTL